MAASASARLSPELKAALRFRMRHIHLPDRAPLYAPRAIPGAVRDQLEYLIGVQRVAAADPGSHTQVGGAGDGSSGLADELRSWLQHAPPPPTVLSFTRRPTYVLPKHHVQAKESWEVDYLFKTLKAKMDIAFPEPPGWSSLPWRPPWDEDKDERQLNYDPLRHSWEPGVMVMPCAEPMFFGPGQLTLWPVIDLLDTVQRGKTFRTKYEFERLLEATTIKVLQREYGITGFSILGSPGIWVESNIPPQEIRPGAGDLPSDNIAARQQNIRKIATIHADVVDNITRFGVSIHVGSPSSSAGILAAQNNPWIPLREYDQTTSIAAELAHIGFVPRPTDPGQHTGGQSNKSPYLRTLFAGEGPFSETGIKAVPYSSVLVRRGLRMPAPLGLDNRDLSTAWTYEFARQLGLHDGVIDHFSLTTFGTKGWNSSLPNKMRYIGFISRRVAAEHLIAEPYDEVRVPIINLSEDREVTKEILDSTNRIVVKDGQIGLSPEGYRAVSWPMYHQTLADVLDGSIRASAWDTRYYDFMWQEEKAARKERRMEMLKMADALEERWNHGPQANLIRRPLTDSIVERMMESVLEMRKTLASLQLRSSWKQQKLQHNLNQMDKILQSRVITTKEENTDDKGAPPIGTSDWPRNLHAFTRPTNADLEEVAANPVSEESAEGQPDLAPSTRQGAPLAPPNIPNRFGERTKRRHERQVEREAQRMAMVERRRELRSANESDPLSAFAPRTKRLAKE